MIDAYAAFEYLITVNRIIIYRIKNLIFLAISVRWFIDNFSYIKRSTQSLARNIARVFVVGVFANLRDYTE